ncbi:MAG TPA: CPBP family intramembrane glutamic endopeptidase [Longimicrobiales bacterium]|nr:CPBP family intramembrane glutamic endopeptidase [Longimicrobiales bacterium]
MDSGRRQRTLNVLAVIAGSVLVWLGSPELAWPARLMTMVLLVVMPGLLLVQGRMADRVPEGITRTRLYGSSVLTIWILVALVTAAAWGSGFTLRLLGLVVPAPPRLALVALLTTAVGAAAMIAGRLLRLPETVLLTFVLPRTRRERILFLGVALSAGVAEEFVFRSFLIPALQAATDNVWLAVALSSGAFGLIHSYQGMSGALRASLLGLLLAVPFIATGSVLPSMAAHTALDIIGGLWLGDWLIRH